MNLSAIMDEIGTKLAAISGLRVYDYPPSTISPPSAYVSYPDSIDYHQTYRSGMSRINQLTVVVVDGKVTDRSARDRITAWVAESGSKSIKATLEGATYTNLYTLVVTNCIFDIVTIAGVDYIAAMFSLDITGPGSEA